MSERERYKQTNRLKRVYKNKVQIHLRPSDKMLEQIQLYKFRTDTQGSTQLVIAKMIDQLSEFMTYGQFCKEDPDLAIKLRREKDKQKWIDFCIDENLSEKEIDAICCALQTAKMRMEREK